jgi:hypothetical protein
MSNERRAERLAEASCPMGRARRTVTGRTLLVLFFCAGIAFLGLLAGGEHRTVNARRAAKPMANYFGTNMPHYPSTVELPAGSSMRVGSAPLRMSFFSTPDEPAKVGRFYASFWRSRRLYVREDVTHVGGVVSAVDAGEGIIYQVLLSRQQDQTMVFPSTTQKPLSLLDTSGQVPVVPLYPGSRTLLTMADQEDVGRARVFLSTNEGSLEENVRYYRQALGSAGFRPETSKDAPLNPEHRFLLYRKGEQEVTINFSALGPHQVRVHLMEVKP